MAKIWSAGQPPILQKIKMSPNALRFGNLATWKKKTQRKEAKRSTSILKKGAFEEMARIVSQDSVGARTSLQEVDARFLPVLLHDSYQTIK